MTATPTLPELKARELERELRDALRGEVSFDQTTRGIHAADASHYQTMPACVVVPRDADDCVTAIKAAHAHGLAITPRGGGTSLSGQTFGPGMVIDVSKYMDGVLEINEQEQWARVQPGVVRDRLNAQLKPMGLHFAPDPATGNRATVGGMVGNNTSGTRSIVYGKTIDHTLACKVALSDGTVLELDPHDPESWDEKCIGNTAGPREAALYHGVRELIEAHREQIAERYPKVMRRVSGYNLDEFVDGAGYTGPIGPRSEINAGRRPWHLGNLVVGSEGTLAFLLEAKIRLTPLPKATAVCVVHFDDDLDALAHVPAINAHGPSAVELLDRLVLRAAKVNPSTRHMATFIEGDPAAVLICEFFGESEADASDKVHRFADDMRAAGVGQQHILRTDAEGQRDVWETRKLGLGLISNVPGPVKGQAFVEDACVPVEVLSEYIGKLREACTAEGIETSMYAHASVGVIHFRPAVDLHLPEHRAKMHRIAQKSFDLVSAYGGVVAGEHGDGMVRGEFIEQCFGPQLYGAFKQLKALFDPTGIMNPGKVIDTPSMVDPAFLRYGDAYRVAEVPASFSYTGQALPGSSKAEGFRLAVEQCNGVGACRKVGGGTMCPSYMATRDEEHTTRGRANALRMAMSGQLGDNDLTSDRIKDVLSLCLSCKACKTECPNAVDMSKLKADVAQMRYDKKGTPLGAKLIGRMPDKAHLLAGPMSPVVNFVQKLGPYKWVFEKLSGIDRRRPMPAFAKQTFMKAMSGRPSADRPAPLGEVALVVDTWSNCFEPNVGLAAVELLESCGYRVTLANAGDAQRPRLSKGLVHEAKRNGQRVLSKLDAVGDTPDTPLLCLEPSDCSALTDDLPDLIDDKPLGERVASRVKMIDVFLAEAFAAGDIKGFELAQNASPDILLHGHCHQKALFGTKSIHAILNSIDGVTCNEVDSGCCGMAGSFGYEHYDLSQKIGEDRLFPAVREAQQKGQTLVACGISCRHQVHDFLDVKAKHFVEVVRGVAQPKSS
ncbi:MAG: FAD-binding and (Fe-S)-binding domain-containing protein [Phycisphaerales bacterium JB063]